MSWDRRKPYRDVPPGLTEEERREWYRRPTKHASLSRTPRGRGLRATPPPAA